MSKSDQLSFTEKSISLDTPSGVIRKTKHIVLQIIILKAILSIP